MPRLNELLDFSTQFVALLPPLSDVRERSNEFWNLLEVNAPAIIESLGEQDFIRSKLSSFDNGIKQTICICAGLQPLQRSDDEENLIQYFANNPNHTGIQTIFLLAEFLYRRRPDAIETISKLILPADHFNLVFENEIERNTKRFCFALLAFLESHHNLRILMLFENAERVGYQRYHLTTKIPEIDDHGEIEEILQRTEEIIENGVDRGTIEVGLINDVLEEYERIHGQKQSLCFDVFQDNDQETTLVFILRTLRETSIREVEEIIFAEEAELIVLRISDRTRTIDEHSSSGVGLQIATALTSSLLGEENIQYIPSEELTQLEDLQHLINTLMDESDNRIQFREVYLDNAPIDGSPILIIRSDEDQTLVRSLEYLTQRNVDLLNDFADIRNIKIGFVVTLDNNDQKSYSFKVTIKPLGRNSYFLPFSTANIATQIRKDFEAYLRNIYNVRVFPGKS